LKPETEQRADLTRVGAPRVGRVVARGVTVDPFGVQRPVEAAARPSEGPRGSGNSCIGLAASRRLRQGLDQESALVNQTFLDYYRCPESFANFALTDNPGKIQGFFRFGGDVVCYGSRSARAHAAEGHEQPYDALDDATIDGGSVRLPFDPAEITENLRRERYPRSSSHEKKERLGGEALSFAYRAVRPALPVVLRKYLQRLYLRGWKKLVFPRWPVDLTVEGILERLFGLTLKAHAIDRIPFIWFWPDGAPACAIVTHDVETLRGRNFCSRLMDLDDSAGIKSSFQIVPEQRYSVPTSLLDGFRRRGFEINVHDVNHDGRLFASRERFLRRAKAINRYGKEWAAIGFRSGGLYRNPEWLDDLEFAYDMSIPNVAHLDPQRGGCCTVVPFFIGRILELPLTTTQDYSLFHILNEYSIDLWKRQIALITERHGLVSLLIHPDYVAERRAGDTYRALLDHLAQLRADGLLWLALPREVNQWWRERSLMKVVRDGDSWHIEGRGKERARLDFGTLRGEKVVLTVEGRD